MKEPEEYVCPLLIKIPPQNLPQIDTEEYMILQSCRLIINNYEPLIYKALKAFLIKNLQIYQIIVYNINMLNLY
ncbi:hypothetical protein M769_0109660 [Bacillus haynesii]|nr:hypothetical protein M769_0109660 [Bacillus haynesii]